VGDSEERAAIDDDDGFYDSKSELERYIIDPLFFDKRAINRIHRKYMHENRDRRNREERKS